MNIQFRRKVDQPPEYRRKMKPQQRLRYSHTRPILITEEQAEDPATLSEAEKAAKKLHVDLYVEYVEQHRTYYKRHYIRN